MQKITKLYDLNTCSARKTGCTGVALVNIGNVLRQDDGVGQAVLDKLSESYKDKFCRFDLGTYSSHLIDCLEGHDMAIVIDATLAEGNPGKVTVLDLNKAIGERQALKLNSCHGFSLLDELQIAKWHGHLPPVLYFFGIETNNTDWTEGLTPSLKAALPQITEQLRETIKTLSQGESHA